MAPGWMARGGLGLPLPAATFPAWTREPGPQKGGVHAAGWPADGWAVWLPGGRQAGRQVGVARGRPPGGGSCGPPREGVERMDWGRGEKHGVTVGWVRVPGGGGSGRLAVRKSQALSSGHKWEREARGALQPGLVRECRGDEGRGGNRREGGPKSLQKAAGAKSAKPAGVGKALESPGSACACAQARARSLRARGGEGGGAGARSWAACARVRGGPRRREGVVQARVAWLLCGAGQKVGVSGVGFEPTPPGETAT